MLPGERKHAESYLLIVEGVSLAGSMEGICTEVFLHLLLVVSVCACVCVRAVVLMWESEDNLPESVLSFYHMGSRDQFPVSRLSGRRFYPLIYLINSYLKLYFISSTSTSQSGS